MGGGAAFANYVSRFFFNIYFPFQFAVIFSYIFGMMVALPLYRYFVFTISGRGIRYEVVMFVFVNLIGMTVSWTVSVGLAMVVFPAVGFNYYTYEIAHLFGVAAPAISSFIGHHLLTFRPMNEKVSAK